ncbi:MAG: hypothetical protein H6809_04880 [Phycisphaeraceae bacterium]|nr:hypothetical protein [Phycisphaeraceae bacterium]
MARNDIGSLSVRLHADTAGFARQMALAERSVERVATTTKRSIPAIGAFGSAIGRASLGRGAALGAAGLGIGEAIGVGALAGGGVGVAIAGFTIALNETVGALQRQRAAIRAEWEARDKLVETVRQQAEEAQRLVVSIGGGAPARVQAAFQTYRQQLTVLEEQVAARSADLQRLGSVDPSVNSGLRGELERLREAIRVLNLNYQRQVARIEGRPDPIYVNPGLDAAAEEQRYQNLINGRFLGADLFPLIEGGGRTNIFGAMAEAAREQAAEAKAQREATERMEQELSDWTRSQQRQTDQIVTSANRINTQVQQLLARRN